MKINEVEKELNIPKATIRFYEKENLLQPKRNDNSYREYSEEDIELLKKIVVLRKIGISIEDVKLLLSSGFNLQDVLFKNMESLNKQIEEIEGALKMCELMQKRQECIDTFDVNYYWEAIHTEELKGNKFFEIINDVIDFEKKVIGDEFGLLDDNGNFKYSLTKSIIIAFCLCVCCGILWFIMDGEIEALIEGFLFPFVCILISSVLGLPVYFVEKKNKKVADFIKKLGMALGVVFLVVIIILMFVL